MHRISRDSLESLASKINNKQKLLLTGGTGFFGKSIIKFLINLSKTHNVNLDLTILSRSASKFYEKYQLYKYLFVYNYDLQFCHYKCHQQIHPYLKQMLFYHLFYSNLDKNQKKYHWLH